jgi:hypothetical protein
MALRTGPPYVGYWLNSNKGTKRNMAISLIPFDRLDFRTLDYPQNGAAPARGTPRKWPENCLKIEGHEVLLSICA